MRIKHLFVLAVLALLTGCSSLTPSTLTNAINAHANFPSLSMAVQDCVADYPDVRAEIVEPFNGLVDKWSAASELKPDASLITALVGAPMQVQDAQTEWVAIKTSITDAGIDCGPAVASQVQNIERTFGELQSAVLSNERAVYALEWGNLLASVVLGRRGEVTRMAL